MTLTLTRARKYRDCAACGLANTQHRGVSGTTRIPSINPPNKTDMHYEVNRLDSFATWPRHAHAERRLLARDGLKYSGQDDMVTCAFCFGRLSLWQTGDVPSLD